jgi:hypothetical protein
MVFSPFVTRRIVPLHPLIEVVNIDTRFDEGRQGPCIICGALRNLRSERIGLLGSGGENAKLTQDQRLEGT